MKNELNVGPVELETRVLNLMQLKKLNGKISQSLYVKSCFVVGLEILVSFTLSISL